MALAALMSLFWAGGGGRAPLRKAGGAHRLQSSTLGPESRQPVSATSVLGHSPARLGTVPSDLASPLQGHLHASLALLSVGSSLEASGSQQQGRLRIALASQIGRNLAIRELVEFLITCRSFCQGQAPARRGQAAGSSGSSRRLSAPEHWGGGGRTSARAGGGPVFVWVGPWLQPPRSCRAAVQSQGRGTLAS